MMVSILNLLFVSQLQTLSCHIDVKSSEIAVFKVRDLKTEIGIESKLAHLISCQEFPGFKNLIVAEISLGANGTTAREETSSLLIFQVRNKKLIPVVNKEIRYEFTSINAEGKKVTTEDSKSYKLTTSKAGNPVLAIEGEPEITLDVSI